MPSKNWEHNVTISRSRDDAHWVDENLCGPLSRSRKAVDGTRDLPFFQQQTGVMGRYGERKCDHCKKKLTLLGP